MDTTTFEILMIVFCCMFLYLRFCHKPKVKIIKAPRPKDIRRQRKKERRIKKIKRRFRIPYRGKTQIIEYSKTAPYIESAWNEIEKKQHGNKKGRGI